MKVRRSNQIFISILLLAGLILSTMPSQSTRAAGAWLTAATMNVGRSAMTSTLLTNGKILVAGGSGSGGALTSSELYDPGTGPGTDSWAFTGSLHHSRRDHTATLLANGKVLVTGGLSGGYLNSSEIYDPTSGTWTDAASLQSARILHTATRLANGDVLVAGGVNNNGVLSAAELYDPGSDTWMATGSMNFAREEHTATLLQDGRVLVVGGTNDSSHTTILASAEIYDPTTGIWTMAPHDMSTPRYAHTATLVSNGKVLVVGGATRYILLNTAELFNPADGTWTTTSTHLTDARYQQTATLLTFVDHPEAVLIAGGLGASSTYLNSSELYDPAGDTWTLTGAMINARTAHNSVQTLDGRVLAIGGIGTGGLKLNTSELYDPTPPDLAPATPTPISPTGVTNMEPSYVWNYSRGATAYHLTVYNTSTSSYIYNNIPVNTSFCTAGICTYHPAAELDTGNYEFKVNASNSFATSNDSDWLTFIVHGNNHITGNAGTTGVTFNYFDVRLKAVTSADDDYDLTVSYNWTGTITPTKPGYTFNPPSITFSTPVTSNQDDFNFTATRIPVTISGNAGSMSGVTMKYTLDGVAQTATSGAGGAYTVSVFWGWTGTVKPIKVGYVFTPLSKPYNSLTLNKVGENYTAALTNFTISGNTVLGGVTLSYVNGTPQTTTSGSDGSYSITVPASWSGSIIPSLTGFSFSPNQIDITEIPGNLTNQKFTPMLTLSGNVGVGGAGATINYNGQSGPTAYNGATSADGSGDYSFRVPLNWVGRITAIKNLYSFMPTYITITDPVVADISGLNFTSRYHFFNYLPLVIRN